MSAPTTTSGLIYRRTEIEQVLAIDLTPDAWLADRLSPVTMVGAANGVMDVVSFAEALKIPADDLRSPDGGYARAEFKTQSFSWQCKERGREIPVDEFKTKVYVGGGALELYSAKRIVRDMLRLREQRVVKMLTDTSVWTGSTNTFTAAGNWNNNATDVSVDVRQAVSLLLNKCGATPITANVVLVISFNMWQALSNNKAVLDRIKYVQFVNGRIALPQLAAALGVSEVIVGAQPVNSANDNATPSVSTVWPDATVGVYVVGTTGDVFEPCVSKTLAFGGDGGTGPNGVAVENYYEPRTRQNVFRARYVIDEKLYDTAFGVTITSAYS